MSDHGLYSINMDGITRKEIYMKEKKLPIAICIVLLVINTVLAFDLFGMPKGNVDPAHFRAAYVSSGTYLVLSEDVVGVTDEGVERTFSKGEEVCVCKYDPEDNSPVVRGEFLGETHTPMYNEYKLSGAVYEDISEEVSKKADLLNEQQEAGASEAYESYIAKSRVWFLHQGEGIYNNGAMVETIQGSYLLGLIGAAIVAIPGAILLFRCRRKGRYASFVVVNVLLFGVLLAGLFVIRSFMPLCR